MAATRSCILCILFFLLSACGWESATLSPLPASAPVLAFGDILTAGFGANAGQSYPDALASSATLNIVNAGISGELSSEGLQRLPELLRQHSPQLVILCHGGNDLLRSTGMDAAKSNILEMIAMVRQQDAEVLLLGVPRPGIFLSTAELYDEIAEETQVAYMQNVITDVLSDNSLKSDAAHPNALGYSQIASQVESFLYSAGAL